MKEKKGKSTSEDKKTNPLKEMPPQPPIKKPKLR
jgi:hypothetical protein